MCSLTFCRGCCMKRGIYYVAVLLGVIFSCSSTTLVSAADGVGAESESEFAEFRFDVEPADRVAVRGKPALLNCSVVHDGAGRPAPRMSWLKDGTLMKFDVNAKRKQLENGSLLFQEVVHSKTHRPDEGLYQCVASAQGVGVIVSRKAKLQVAYLGKEFISEPADLSVHLGDVAVLHCALDALPSPPEVTWFKDGLTVTPRAPHRVVYADGSLEIGQVAFEDIGTYRCRVSVPERTRTSRDARLTQNAFLTTYKNVPPRFAVKPKSSVALEGTTVEFYCAANGRGRNDDRPSIKWLKQGVTIDFKAKNTRYSLLGSGSLRIDGVQDHDSGLYTCRATNSLDSVDADASLTVHVAPRFRRRPSNSAARVREDVHFECDVSGTPPPRVRWLKDGDLVIPSDYFQVTEGRGLRVLGLVESDAGVYQCTAENSAGNVQSSAQLRVLPSS